MMNSVCLSDGTAIFANMDICVHQSSSNCNVKYLLQSFRMFVKGDRHNCSHNKTKFNVGFSSFNNITVKIYTLYCF